MDLETIHILATLAGIAASGFVAYLGLLIKNEQARVRVELSEFNGKILTGQHKLREDFNEKHAENSQTIAVHIASDEAKFDSIQKTLTQIDNKLDRRLPSR